MTVPGYARSELILIIGCCQINSIPSPLGQCRCPLSGGAEGQLAVIEESSSHPFYTTRSFTERLLHYNCPSVA